jgi:hypothetical protein
MNTSLFHTNYTRSEALEIIKARVYEDAVDDPECLPFAYCRHLADCAYEFYLKQSNVSLEIELSRISGDIPTVIDC